MTKKGGSTVLKREAAPRFWRIPRKRYPFTIRVSPGPHPHEEAYPLAVIIRELLGLVKTYREARIAIKRGKVLVDGVVRKDPGFPVGLMDVVEIPDEELVFRLVPHDGSPLELLQIPAEEKGLKLCKVVGKLTVKGGRLQYGLHDGRSLLAGNGQDAYNTGDTLLLEVPKQAVREVFPLEKGALVLVVKGERAGQLAKVLGLEPGTFSRERMAELELLGGGRTKLPVRLLMVVGREKPALTIA